MTMVNFHGYVSLLEGKIHVGEPIQIIQYFHIISFSVLCISMTDAVL